MCRVMVLTSVETTSFGQNEKYQQLRRVPREQHGLLLVRMPLGGNTCQSLDETQITMPSARTCGEPFRNVCILYMFRIRRKYEQETNNKMSFCPS